MSSRAQFLHEMLYNDFVQIDYTMKLEINIFFQQGNLK